MQAAVLTLDDSDWEVREQLAASLGELPAARARPPSRAARATCDDPVAMDAALSGWQAANRACSSALLRAGDETPQRDAAITMLAATIVRGAQDGAVQTLFDSIATARAGLAAIGAAARGGGRAARARRAGIGASTRPRGARNRVPTCPGGTRGPGGAAAFPTGRGAR